MTNIRKVNLLIINLLIIVSIGLLVYQTILWQQELISVKTEIIKYDKINTVTNLDNNKLQELIFDVKRIENIQNERFSMLGWGLSILFTTKRVNIQANGLYVVK